MYNETAPIQKTEIRAQLPNQKYKVGTTRRVPGHRMFEINQHTGQIREATFQEATVYADPVKKHLHKKRLTLVVQEGCWYIQALNKKNALRKFEKIS